MNGPTQQITAHSVVCARPELLSSEMSATEAVMLHLDKGTYFGVESVAKTIWDTIATPMAVRNVSDVVQQQYDVDAETALADTIEFVQNLLTRDLVTVQPARSSDLSEPQERQPEP